MSMPDLGTRGNVMGPQPIGRRTAVPPEMIAAAEEALALMLRGKVDDLANLAMPNCAQEVADFAAAVLSGACDGFEIIATARVNHHHFVKARLTGVQPQRVQFRLGEHGGRWMIWDLMNLTGRRGAWTR